MRKDISLNELANRGNVAQFVSFTPDADGPKQTFCRVASFQPNHHFRDLHTALTALLEHSPEKSVNLRSFSPDNPRSREFIYGLKIVEEACQQVNRLTAEGLFVIANETVDVHDGGVSGVAEAGVLEFAPDDTPRCVEKPGTVALRHSEAISLLKCVYGFDVALPESAGCRMEFSIHPRRRGYHNTHTLLWEYEKVSTSEQNPTLFWPNRFSRLVGDKVFGLLVADMLGARVPRSIVISRRIRPFTFGQDTGSSESWLRTSPSTQDPGKYTTTSTWIDPFELLEAEDPQKLVASIVSQAAVPAVYSGAAIALQDTSLHIEGVIGEGDKLMLGKQPPIQLPPRVLSKVREVNELLTGSIGPVRFEWVYDGHCVWVVQLHRGATTSTFNVLVPGYAEEWRVFECRLGLECLRQTLAGLPDNVGLVFDGAVGLTSHLADLARKSGRPTRISAASSRSLRQQYLF